MELRGISTVAPAGPASERLDAARRAAQEFETVALAELLRPMFDALDVDGLGGGGDAERMFRPMLVEQYAQRLAAQGGVGLADAVLRELVGLQQPSAAPSPSSSQNPSPQAKEPAP